MTLTKASLLVVAVFGLAVATVSGVVWFVGLGAVVLGFGTLFALLMTVGVWRAWWKLVAADSGKSRLIALADLALFSLMAAGAVMFILNERGAL